MNTRTNRAPKGKQQFDITDSVAALRCLAALCGRPTPDMLNDEEAYGMEVLLNLIADKVEGGAA